MSKLKLVLITLTIALLTCCTGTYLASNSPVVVESAEDAMTATVFVQRYDGGSGSGFHIGDGYFVTNWHVVSHDGHPDKWTAIRLDDVFAEVIAQDKRRDLAIIYCAGLAHLPRFEASKSKSKLGDRVYSLGSHFGHVETYSGGNIAGFKNYDDLGEVIITTCPMNPGCSGGPLVNRHFRLIGINVAGIFAYRQYAGVSLHIQAKILAEYITELKTLHGNNAD